MANAIVPSERHASITQAFSMHDIERVAQAIAKGGLFGSRDPYAVLTLCLLAQAEGQHPAVVFRDYHIISGKPAKKADAMLRDFISAGGKVEWHQLDDECADATFTHPSGSARISWDKARVQQAQLGGNAMHKKYPRQMLRSRVISEGVRTVFPGATSGLYEVSEVQDMVVQDAPAVPAPVQQIEHQREPEPKEEASVDSEQQQARKRIRYDGMPYETPTALKAAVRTFMIEVNRAPDPDSLDALIVSEKALLDQVKQVRPDWWEGSPDIEKGIAQQLAERQTSVMAEAIEEGHYVPGILDAG